jgi:hypothetical protein
MACQYRMTMTLSARQRAALEYVEAYALARQDRARADQNHIRRMCDLAPEAMLEALACIERHARVALHFHPDRPAADGQTVARGLLEQGRYRSQFETRISNGRLSAHPGGRRDACEHGLFGGAYHAANSLDGERPKYGALDLLQHAEGPSPRFGSCYFLLGAHVSRRCTFTYRDSHDDPSERGTLAVFADIFGALLRDVFFHECALGERDLTVPALLRRLSSLQAPLWAPEVTAPVRNLNQYIEAQVHGDVLLSRDADVLVADPSFRDTETGAVLLQLCQRYQLQLHWHHGFRLHCAHVPRDFRGPTMPALAERVAPSGVVDASQIGVAVRDLHANPDTWRDHGSFADALQELKLLWHVLVKYGDPA